MQRDLANMSHHRQREQREREFARREREQAARVRTEKAAEEHMAKCRGMLVNLDDERRARSMKLNDFLPLIEKTKTDDQLRAIAECATACCDLSEAEWPELSAAVNKRRKILLGAA